jgi:hypothetical protein
MGRKSSAEVLREFAWKSAGHKPTVSAEVYGKVMEDVAAENGGDLLDSKMVDAARDPNSPIHGAFEWDDEIAGEKHRIEQAAWYRRHIVVIVSERKDPKKEPKKTVRVAYVSVTNSKGERVHRDTVKVMSSEETRVQAIGECLNLLLSIRKRFAHLSDIAALKRIFDTIDGAADTIGRAM